MGLGRRDAPRRLGAPAVQPLAGLSWWTAARQPCRLRQLCLQICRFIATGLPYRYPRRQWRRLREDAALVTSPSPQPSRASALPPSHSRPVPAAACLSRADGVTTLALTALAIGATQARLAGVVRC